MAKHSFATLLLLATAALLAAAQLSASCNHTATSRQCWGDLSIDTNYYTTIPDTGITREYWLSAESGLCAPDGYQRICKTFNGSIPGPAIVADWGDEVVIHVTNNLDDNGTAVHWHGVRMLNSNEYDGVPGVTQCPIPTGETMTYRFHASQYGSSYYHSHHSLQYGDGLFGPIILNVKNSSQNNCPATANYDEDLGPVFLHDWDHTDIFTLWHEARRTGIGPELDTGLINGTNVWDCTESTDEKCVGGGKKFEVVFEPGKKYRLRLISAVIEGHFQFTIDNHNLTVIANDLVPIVPYVTDSVLISAGQRYDVIVEANAEPGDYWLRAGWAFFCSAHNKNPLNMTGIVRYDKSSNKDPTSEPTAVRREGCADEPLESLVPYLQLDVTNMPNITMEVLSNAITEDDATPWFTWMLNSSSLLIDWANPTLRRVLNNESIFPTDLNVVSVQNETSEPEWAVLVIQDTKDLRFDHPIHLHGHDFWILAQSDEDTQWNWTVPSTFNTRNPLRRDTATLRAAGYLAIAFQLDNPGVWLCHCHLAWHASEGLSLEFVERRHNIARVVSETEGNDLRNVCSSWGDEELLWVQEDSGV